MCCWYVGEISLATITHMCILTCTYLEHEEGACITNSIWVHLQNARDLEKEILALKARKSKEKD